MDLRKVVEDESNFPTVEQIYESIHGFIEMWSSAASAEEKNQALKNLVKRIIYNREEIRIELTVCYR